MTKFESAVRVVPYSQERVYEKLSDLSKLEAITEHLPQDKVKELSFDVDTLSFSIAPVGQLTLKIVEREPFSCVTFETINSPLPFNLWIQIASITEEACELKLTIALDVNPFMKAMVQKPLQEGVEKIAEMLAAIAY